MLRISYWLMQFPQPIRSWHSAMGNFGICKFCGSYGKFVKAHIIPQAMYRHNEDIPLMVMNVSRAERPRRSPTGLWDATILCGACEDRLQYLDEAAEQILVDGRASALPIRTPTVSGGDALDEDLAILFPNADGASLKLFALFVLWRAAVSSRPECASVKLGFHATRIKRMLRRGDARRTDILPTILQYEADEPMCSGALFPMRTYVEGVEFWTFTCGGYTFLTKTEEIDSSLCEAPLVLGSNQHVLALKTQFKDQKFAGHTARVLRDANVAFGDPWRGLRKAE